MARSTRTPIRSAFRLELLVDGHLAATYAMDCCVGAIEAAMTLARGRPGHAIDLVRRGADAPTAPVLHLGPTRDEPVVGWAA
jgi:hypothetical protein